MKLILSGPTGFIGSSILTHALANPEITSLVALSRKPLEVQHPKLTVVIVEDFLSYSSDVLKTLEGADGCIWTIGAKALTNPEVTQRVTVDYTMAAAKAFSTLSPPKDGNKFRFVFTSGRMSEADRNHKLWAFKEARYISGSIETKLLNYAASEEHKNKFEVFIVKPAMVLGEERSIGNVVVGVVMPSIVREVLVAGMMELVVKGGEKKVLDNGELVKFGKEVMKRGD